MRLILRNRLAADHGEINRKMRVRSAHGIDATAISQIRTER